MRRGAPLQTGSGPGECGVTERLARTSPAVIGVVAVSRPPAHGTPDPSRALGLALPELRQRHRQRVDVVQRIDVAGFAVADQIGCAADGVADDAGQPGGQRFVDDQTPGLGEIARQRQAVGERIRFAELALVQEADHLRARRQAASASARTVALERSGADDHQRRARREPRHRAHDVHRPLGGHQLADEQHHECVGIDAPSAARRGAHVGVLIRRRRGREHLVVDRVRHLKNPMVRHAVPEQVFADAHAGRQKAVELAQEQARS